MSKEKVNMRGIKPEAIPQVIAIVSMSGDGKLTLKGES
jgi:hypothetical protein